MEFCRSDAFGHRGSLFLAQFGTYAPLNTPDPAALDRGFRVVRIDLDSGSASRPRNRHPAPRRPPGVGWPGAAGRLQVPPGRPEPLRPDFGVTVVAPTHVVAYARTGVLWRVTRL